MLLPETIEKAVLSQREIIEKEEKIIERVLAKRIKIQNKFAVLISGIRRSGKSTLMKSMAKNLKSFYFISFEDSKLVGFDLGDFERLDAAFLKVYGESEYYFFDEIQLIDKWEWHIRKLLDQRKYVVITGSNASLLSRELGTKLTGRNLRYELFPFSYIEYLSFSHKKGGVESFQEYLITGGFPEYLLLKDQLILQNLLVDSLFRDIAIRHKVRNVKQLNELALFLLTNVTKEFSYNNLRKMFDFGSSNSVSKFISFFEESYLLFTIPKFDYSLKKQLVNNKKVYAVDNGLVVQNSKTFSEDLGKLLENLVFIHLKSQQKDVFYFREKKECDFVVRSGSKIVEAYQVCYALDEFNKEREIGGLLEALQKLDLQEGVILTLKQEDSITLEKKNIRITPVWKWLMAY